MLSCVFVAEGHLIDSGILASILNLIVVEGADYNINDFVIGKTNYNPSRLEIEVKCGAERQMEAITERLVRLGCFEKTTPEAVIKEASKDRCVPEDFYSTTNHRTEVFLGGEWNHVRNQRMDGVIAVTPDGPVCKKLRDVEKGDSIICSADSVRVFPPER